jgi:hypothetical protein
MAKFKSEVGKKVFCGGIGVLTFKTNTLITDCSAAIIAMRGANGVHEVDAASDAASTAESEIDAAREAYLVKFGEKPHGNTSLEKLLQEINAPDGE